ncbi:MAG: AAA family ATPase [Chlorobium sp.]
MIDRKLTATLQRLAQTFPIIAITGPRQSGKTTMAKAVFAEKPYITLEDPAERTFALEEAKGFLHRFRDGAIFDEAQRWPDLFSYLHMVDEEPIPGIIHSDRFTTIRTALRSQPVTCRSRWHDRSASLVHFRTSGSIAIVTIA